MNHLILSAHPSPNSFSNYLAQQLTIKYEELGWEVDLRDLYKINFNPVLSASDLSKMKSGETPDDIKVEQDIVAKADLISVIYPLWWASFPAILKGYIDRVFTNGFAFRYSPEGVVGLLTEKRVVLHTTMGNTVEEYEEKGLIDAFRASQGDEVFTYCGMQVVDHLFYPQITLADEKKRNHFLEVALEAYSAEITSDIS